ncbi:cytochrome c oxidase biogenesis protein Cmc1-like protein isoform X2 [Wolffia australiana]
MFDRRNSTQINTEKIIEEFQKCHADHPIRKFFGECTELKIKLDRCFRQEKAVKRKANFEESKKLKERLQAYRKEMAKETQHKDPQSA